MSTGYMSQLQPSNKAKILATNVKMASTILILSSVVDGFFNTLHLFQQGSKDLLLNFTIKPYIYLYQYKEMVVCVTSSIFRVYLIIMDIQRGYYVSMKGGGDNFKDEEQYIEIDICIDHINSHYTSYRLSNRYGRTCDSIFLKFHSHSCLK